MSLGKTAPLRESIAQGRTRYARRFLLYLDRAKLTKTSFAVVTHGECFPACAPLFPELRDCSVKRADFCADVVGELRLTKEDFALPDPDALRAEPELQITLLEQLYAEGFTCEVEKAGKKSRLLPSWFRTAVKRSTSLTGLFTGLLGTTSFAGLVTGLLGASTTGTMTGASASICPVRGERPRGGLRFGRLVERRLGRRSGGM